MFKVNDQLSVAIYVNDKELVLTGGNLMQSLWIRADALFKLPLMVFRYVDLHDATAKVGLQDNVPVIVSFSGVINVERYFRVHSWTRIPVGEGYSYTVNCYWNSPKFWITTTNSNIRGTSFEVIRQIAKTCKLEFSQNSTQTADSMLWSGGNRTYNEYVRDIARHGYVDDSSQMVLGVDTEGLLKYMNINAIPKPTVKFGHTAQATKEPFIQLLDFTPKSVSGDNNAVAGYHHDRHVQGLEKDEVQKSVSLTPDCRKPLVNKEVRNEIARGGVSYAPIDCGANVHPKYERAIYQNTRFNLLNGLRGTFLIGVQTDMDLFDNFSYVPPAQLSSEAYAGEYTISGKIIHIAGNSYYEKFTAAKNGLET